MRIVSSRFGKLVSAIMIVGALFLSSCSATPLTSPSSPEGSTTSLALTKPYGSLTIATNVGNGHLDPLLGGAIAFSTLGSAVFDTLWYWNPQTNERTPGIAERWEISPDGLTHTFYIRKGIKFHDGSDLTGADVKFSIERMLRPEGITSDAPQWRAAIASVEMKDDYTVVLRMKTPQFELLPNQYGAMTPVMPKKYIEDKGDKYFADHPVGSGPWKVTKFQLSISLELEAVDSHWRAVPKFQNLTILGVSEMSTKVAMLRTGELDAAVISADALPQIEAAGLRVISYWSGGGYYGFPFYDTANPQKYAFGDVRVRKALQLSINAKELADKLFSGRGEPVAVATLYFDSPAEIIARDPNLLKPDPYDTEQAKRMLADAGYANGFNTRIYDTGGGSVVSTLSLVLGGYWGKIGINAKIVPVDYGAFLIKYKANDPETWDGFYPFITAGANTWTRMSTFHHSKKASEKNVNNPRLDWLLDNIPSTKDSSERDRFILEAMGLARQEYNVISILGAHSIIAVGKKIGDVAPARYVYEISGLMLETITHAK